MSREYYDYHILMWPGCTVQHQVKLATAEQIFGEDLFWRGVRDATAGRAFEEIRTPADAEAYERGRLFAIYLKTARGKVLMRPRRPNQVTRTKHWLMSAFKSGAVL